MWISSTSTSSTGLENVVWSPCISQLVTFTSEHSGLIVLPAILILCCELKLTSGYVICPSFTVVKMGLTTTVWEKSMRKNTPWSVKRKVISVIVLCEQEANVWKSRLGERQGWYVRPKLDRKSGSCNFNVKFFVRQAMFTSSSLNTIWLIHINIKCTYLT